MKILISILYLPVMSLGSPVNPSLVVSRVKVNPVTEGRSLCDHTLTSVENVFQVVDILEVSHHIQIIQHPGMVGQLVTRDHDLVFRVQVE